MRDPAPIPLTPLQQGMLFHYLRSPWRGVDLEQIVVRWQRPPADADTLPERAARAFAAVAARHEVLRAACHWEGVDTPVLVPAAALDVATAVVDLQPGEQALGDWLVADREQPLDLGRAPLFRVALLRQKGRPPVMVWTFHHLLLDGRSFPAVLHEVLSLLDGAAPAAPPPATGFGAHSRALTQRDRAAEEAFWRDYLHGFAGARSLSLPRPPAPGSRPHRGHVRRALPRAATAALRELAERTGSSLGTIVQAAWALLLSRYSGEADTLFGIVRAGRRGTVADAFAIVGTFINTVPLRVRVDESIALADWLPALRADQRRVAAHDQASLADVQRWAGHQGGDLLFDSVLVYDHRSLDAEMQALGGPAAACRFELHEQTVFPLTLYAYGEPELLLLLAHDRDRYADAAIAALADQLTTLLAAFPAGAQAPIAALPLLPADALAELTSDLERTCVALPPDLTIVDRIAAALAARAEAVVVQQGESALTGRELDQRSAELARLLRRLGAGRGALVGIAMSRCPAMLAAVLGVWRAGAAYVPLDPAYPAERLRHQLADAAIAIVIADAGALAKLGAAGLTELPATIRVQPASGAIEAAPAGDAAPAGGAAAAGAPRADDLAYVIYTSGSTGRPKGVMVEHRQLLNFCAGMDQVVPLGDNARWLAVTSLAFDISVLELFWTLGRGCTVVLQPAPHGAAQARPGAPSFSLFYFASGQGGSGASRYDLLLTGARFADEHGFEAIWTPERHFHEFGGLYPNPAVASAALATITSRVQLRGGSVVLPLHDPLRVAEEWALVDNLSNGRVGIAIASGWQRDDFVLQPDNYADRKEAMVRGLEAVQRLWRGERIDRRGPDGATIAVGTLPRPVQPSLPVWITTAGNVETWELAGRLGANVLTHLLGQSLDELGSKVDAYRAARRAAGHPGSGQVTLMLHTFVGDSDDEVYQTVRQPMLDYLRSSVGLARNYIGSFPTFKTQAEGEGAQLSSDFAALGEADLQALLEHSFQRYHDQSGLFGTLETCARMVERVQAIGIDEIACLIDFGVPTPAVVAMLDRLGALHRRLRGDAPGEQPADLPTTLVRSGATHLQGTPSLLSMLLQEQGGRDALRRLQCLLVGGEALPAPLARELRQLVPRVVNMYGPTETTVWSATYEVSGDEPVVPIGRPIANTELLVLDARRRVVPPEVTGELYIGGAGTARGYLGQPALTAERFVAHPLAPDRRIYRTGDLVRRRRDGVLEFLGRNDAQVKLRGHRIELGEIEAVLAEHPAVRECAVVVQPHPGGGEQLVAFHVGDAAAAPAALREHLRQRLPEWMVPAAFMALAALPKTPNAKIDRGALRAVRTAAPPPPAVAPTAAAAPASSDHSAASDELERAIGAIWCEVLGVAVVDPLQNFFDLGGHSLLTVQVQGRIKRQLGRAVPLTDLFRFPTLRSLARHLAAQAPTPRDDGQPATRRDHLDRLRAQRERRLQGRG